MRRQTPISHLLYNYLFPHPTTNDPPSFSAHLARNLVPEVRIEVACFYGDLNSVEARYPGLNYCYPPHRMRLGRFKHHKRLFDAFDNLALTYSEIQDFCCWEGTKWARERYEKDENVKVVDTTGDEIVRAVDEIETTELDERRRKSITRKTDISVVVEQTSSVWDREATIREEDEVMDDSGVESGDAEAGAGDDGTNDDEDGDEDGDETPTEAAAREQHVSEVQRRRNVAINQRILTAWENGQSLPPDIEQYLKEESERGTANVGLDVVSFLERRYRNGYNPLSSRRDSPASSPAVPRAAA